MTHDSTLEEKKILKFLDKYEKYHGPFREFSSERDRIYSYIGVCLGHYDFMFTDSPKGANKGVNVDGSEKKELFINAFESKEIKIILMYDQDYDKFKGYFETTGNIHSVFIQPLLGLYKLHKVGKDRMYIQQPVLPHLTEFFSNHFGVCNVVNNVPSYYNLIIFEDTERIRTILEYLRKEENVIDGLSWTGKKLEVVVKYVSPQRVVSKGKYFL